MNGLSFDTRSVIDFVFHIIGICGSIVLVATFVPQTYKTMTKRSVEDLSLLFIILNIISAVLLFMYGIYFSQIPMILSNFSVAINSMIILVYILIHKRKNVPADDQGGESKEEEGRVIVGIEKDN